MKYFISLIVLILLTSCKTSLVTNYKITSNNRTYYTNQFKINNDTIKFTPISRNKIRDSVKLTEYQIIYKIKPLNVYYGTNIY